MTSFKPLTRGQMSHLGLFSAVSDPTQIEYIYKAFNYVAGWNTLPINRQYDLTVKKVIPELGTAMRTLYVLTKGKSNDIINSLLSFINPPAEAPLSDNSSILLNSLLSTGYSTCATKIPISLITELKETLRFIPLEPNSCRAPLSDVNTLLNHRLVQHLLTASDLWKIVDEYLGCRSQLVYMGAWRTDSVSPQQIDVSTDALLYHFDHIANRHLKVFLYLSDVDNENGPHMYVPNTARRQMPEFARSDGRFPDHLISNANLPQRTVTGQAGTLIFADTQNLHKGTLVSGGSRFILELMFFDAVSAYYIDGNIGGYLSLNNNLRSLHPESHNLFS